MTTTCSGRASNSHEYGRGRALGAQRCRGTTSPCWDSRFYAFRTEYDALRRPIRSFVQGGDPYERDARTYPRETLFERTIYGDSADTGLTEHRQRQANLRGQPYGHFDTAGVVTTDRYDFKGNLLHGRRTFSEDYKRVPDWSKSRRLKLRCLSVAPPMTR